eukprot:TRINITY_DN27355_c0_g1_i1.p2 TRINITY_DN27355_c0_g1~~TRINITY_DN27355_c0_g1_i1.p2  ORF type:complete len:109 (+),score=14.00 TRINITY_DN27355_c0_g1_i1:81-407(+)
MMHATKTPRKIKNIYLFFFFSKQKTAYEMESRDWSSTCALPIFFFFFIHRQRSEERFLDRKSVVQGKSVQSRVDLGGRRFIKKKKKNKKYLLVFFFFQAEDGIRDGIS